jgi:hypothetical protein
MMHELFELPRKLNTNFIIKTGGKSESNTTVQDLEQEVLGLENGHLPSKKRMKNTALEDQEEEKELMEEDGFDEKVKMYKLSKKNVKRDEKAQEFFSRAKKDIISVID